MSQSVGTIDGTSYLCAKGLRSRTFTYNFREGSVVFIVEKAKRGIMEAVSIKEVRFISNTKTFAKTIALYVDTLNSLWNEYDLCSEADAKELALLYWMQQEEAQSNFVPLC